MAVWSKWHIQAFCELFKFSLLTEQTLWIYTTKQLPVAFDETVAESVKEAF